MEIGKRYIIFVSVLVVVVSLIGSAQALPDLVVKSITPNCGELFGNESNVIEAEIENIGNTIANASHANFIFSGGYTEKVAVPPLDAGNTTAVYITDSTIRYAGVAVNITVTADCDGVIAESNETNNTLAIDKTVVNNGYKGKRYTGSEDITTRHFHDQAHVNLIYSTGDSKYQGGYNTLWTTYTANWTADDLPIPSGATVKKAVLYTYYTFDRTPAGNVTEYLTLDFNGNVVPIDQHYTDRKGYGSYNYPYGMIRYNVAADFNASGSNNVVLENTEPTSPHHVSLSGMVLMVVYEHADEPIRMIWINEGFDILSARTSYCVTSEEATAYVPFTGGTIESDYVDNATLVTVMQDASDGDDKNRLYFNGGEWHGIWDTAATQGDTSIAINETDVLAYLDATDNEARLQSHIPDGETNGDGMGAANAILMVEYTQPDLIVTAITPNCGYLFANESNDISATIKNNGSADAGEFNVCFVIDGFSATASVSALGAGNDTEVSITDPTLRYAGVAVNITVTADCDGAIAESDETNNTLAIDKTVVNNGYKGKRYTGGSDLETLQKQTLNGDIIYSTGDSYYLSAYSYPTWVDYTASWKASDIPVPDGARIEKARLYVYYTWDKKGVIPDYISLTFNGYSETPDAVYIDSKGYGSYDYPSGMLAYAVNSNFNKSGNTAILTNSYPGGGNVSMQGMLLIVIYADSSEPKRTIWINEECDLLTAKSSYCTTSGEATAYAPFDGAVDLTKVESAKLITVAPSANKDGDMNRLYFNDHVWNGIWDRYVGNNTNLGINETDVAADLSSNNNLAKFQDNGDSMEASNAILVVEYEPTKPASKRGGGGGAPRDSDGDGYSDIQELIAGTDPNNPDDYSGKPTATPIPTLTPTVKPTLTPVPTPVATPVATPASETPTPTPEEPGFEAIFAITGLLAVAYLVLSKNRK